MALAAPPVGYVRVSSTDPPIRVLARLGDGPVTPEAGYGGWQEVARPRRSPLTTWQASPGLRIQVPMMLDAFVAGTSVENLINDIKRMGRPTAKNGEPPIVKVQARGAAVPYQSVAWVIDSIDWGDAIMNDSGNRVRQALTLHLLQHIADVYLQERSAANRQRAKTAPSKPGAAKKRTPSKSAPPSSKKKSGLLDTRKTGLTSAYPFGSGESLVRVAARELGDADRWPEIAALNGLRDPRAVPFGMVLRLP